MVLLFALWVTIVAVLYYIYHGYLIVLHLLIWVAGKRPLKVIQGPLPSVTILLTVHNEEKRIANNLQNLVALDYDPGRLEIIVASDGSTDRTNEIVRQCVGSLPVKLLVFDRLGKSEAQNRAIAQAQGEIVVFTDAECILETNYLRELVRPFLLKEVGCVTAHLRIASGTGAVARNQGYYWSYELKLRELESQLGILAVASGQAMAVRRSAFVSMPPDVGEDCIIPLDVVLQRLRVVHASTALATDTMEDDPLSEYRARVRMTLRNWTGTWRRAALLNPIRYPGYAFALWSHKILRWLSPFFLIVIGLISMAFIRDPLLWLLPMLTLLFFTLAALGWVGQALGFTLPLTGTIYSFCLANVGFLVGLTKALVGSSVVSYGRR
jgi:cellulose synthase/poly-beta-1,6-N-acetylglucosamine synthase-like glycosyltransferase